VLDYLNADDDNRRARRLYLPLLDRMGEQLGYFGDSDQCLEKI